jgi:hypothetical protein
LSYVKTSCTKCDWQGYVHEKDLYRQCKSRYCTGEFVASLIDPRAQYLPPQKSPAELAAEDARIAALIERWKQVRAWWEVESDKGPTRRARPRPADWTDGDVLALAAHLRFDPFPPSLPEQTKRCVSDDMKTIWKPVVEKRAEPATVASSAGTKEVAMLPDKVAPNPAAERIASVARVLDEHARREDAVRRFVEQAPALICDPFGEVDPFSD